VDERQPRRGVSMESLKKVRIVTKPIRK